MHPCPGLQQPWALTRHDHFAVGCTVADSQRVQHLASLAVALLLQGLVEVPVYRLALHDPLGCLGFVILPEVDELVLAILAYAVNDVLCAL